MAHIATQARLPGAYESEEAELIPSSDWGKRTIGRTEMLPPAAAPAVPTQIIVRNGPVIHHWIHATFALVKLAFWLSLIFVVWNTLPGWLMSFVGTVLWWSFRRAVGI